MPKATVEDIEPKRFDLKTCPPDGYVIIRMMSWGEKLSRQERATTQSMKGTPGTQQKNEIEIAVAMAQRATAEYEFAHLIIEHNLEDKNGVKLQFGRPGELDKLHPKIGDEISGYIGEMNNFEDGQGGQQGNSLTDSTPPSS